LVINDNNNNNYIRYIDKIVEWMHCLVFEIDRSFTD